MSLSEAERQRFEQVVLPHLDSAYNLARWLLRGQPDAQDVTQEALLRALRFFPGLHGGNARAWLLKIVRNASYTWLESNRRAELAEEFDEERHGAPTPSPETQAIAGDDRDRLRDALERLPTRFREVLVLRELEGCSYKEIAEVAGLPMGTVMSSLARARRRLQDLLTTPAREEMPHEL